jgi:hypothetical protein
VRLILLLQRLDRVLVHLIEIIYNLTFKLAVISRKSLNLALEGFILQV